MAAVKAEELKEKWIVRIDARGRGSIERNGEKVKNVRAITVRCAAREIPQVDVTFNVGSVSIEVDGEGHELAIGPTARELVDSDDRVVRLREKLIEVHNRAGCGAPAGKGADCSICSVLRGTEG